MFFSLREDCRHRIRDAVNIGILETWAKRQADGVVAERCRHRKIFRLPSKPVLVVRLLRKASVMNTDADSRVAHAVDEIVPG